MNVANGVWSHVEPFWVLSHCDSHLEFPTAILKGQHPSWATSGCPISASAHPLFLPEKKATTETQGSFCWSDKGRQHPCVAISYSCGQCQASDLSAAVTGIPGVI